VDSVGVGPGRTGMPLASGMHDTTIAGSGLRDSNGAGMPLASGIAGSGLRDSNGAVVSRAVARASVDFRQNNTCISKLYRNSLADIPAEHRRQQAGNDQGDSGDDRHRHSGHGGMIAAGLHRLLEDRIDHH